MGYALSCFEDLCKATSKLFNDFVVLSSRYIAPSLDILFASIENEVAVYLKEVTFLADRSSQAKVFTQLVLELKNDKDLPGALKGNTEQDKKIIENARQILLGALIHRYLRIPDEISISKIPSVSSVGSFFGYGAKPKKEEPPPEKKSRLLDAIERILNITEKNKLDDLTIKTTCDSFYAYMERDKRYLTYEHFKNDPNFFAYLKGFINTYTARSKPSVEQINKLLFLVSLSKNLAAIHQDIITLLNEVEKKLSGNEGNADIEQFYNIVRSLSVSQDVKSRLNIIIATPKLAENFTKWKWAQFFTEMREALEVNSAYSLFGGYIVVYHGVSKNQENLRSVLEKALDCNTLDNQLDAKTSLLGLDVLKYWFLNHKNESMVVDWSLFEGNVGKKMFYADYKRVELMLQKQQINMSKIEVKQVLGLFDLEGNIKDTSNVQPKKMVKSQTTRDSEELETTGNQISKY